MEIKNKLDQLESRINQVPTQIVQADPKNTISEEEFSALKKRIDDHDSLFLKIQAELDELKSAMNKRMDRLNEHLARKVDIEDLDKLKSNLT